MLVIISSVLTFFGNWWYWNAWMQHLKWCFEPFEIRVPPFYSFSERRGMNVGANVRLLEDSSFFFVKFSHLNIDLFHVHKRTWIYLCTFDWITEIITCAILRFIEWTILIFWFHWGLLKIKVVLNLTLSSVLLFIWFFTTFWIFAVLFLKFNHNLLELVEIPVV